MTRERAPSNIEEVIRLDEEWRQRYDVDQPCKKRNEAARGIAEAKKSGNYTAADAISAEVASLGQDIDALSEKVDSCLAERDAIRMRVPNILHESVPVGEDDQKNTLPVYTGTRVS